MADEHYIEPGLVAHPGPQITLGGRPYVLAPLPMFLAARLIPEVTRSQAALMKASRDAPEKVMETFTEATKLGVGAIHASLKRNYPALTQEELGEELLDQDNFGVILGQLLNRSQTAVGEKTAAETEAASPSLPPPAES